MSQSNTQQGDVVFVAGDALTDKEGYVVMLGNDAGVAKAYLPNAVTDITPFVVVAGSAAAEQSTLRPLSPDRNVRLKLNGTCSPGDRLVIEAPDGTEDGKVRTLPTGVNGTYLVIAIAEEAGVDEQLVLARPCLRGDVTISGN